MTYGFIDFLKKTSTATMFFVGNKKDFHCTHVFNLIKDGRAKKKKLRGAFFLIPTFFIYRKPCGALFCLPHAFFVSDANVFTASIGISVAVAKAPLTATTGAHSPARPHICFSANTATAVNSNYQPRNYKTVDTRLYRKT